MKYKTFYKLIKNGLRLRQTSWRKNEYVWLNEGQFFDEGEWVAWSSGHPGEGLGTVDYFEFDENSQIKKSEIEKIEKENNWKIYFQPKRISSRNLAKPVGKDFE